MRTLTAILWDDFRALASTVNPLNWRSARHFVRQPRPPDVSDIGTNRLDRPLPKKFHLADVSWRRFPVIP
jgi:hypothetical protein